MTHPDQADAIHILHASRFVRAGGPVVAIASNGVTFRASGAGPVLRAFLATHGGTVEALPEGSFLESGTGVKTCVVAFTACEGCRDMTCRAR